MSEIDARLVDVIRDVYHRPMMYGATPLEVDALLRNFHWFWGLIHNAEERANAVIQDVTPLGRKSVSGSFSRLFRLEHPDGDDDMEIEFVCGKWREVSHRLGIVT